MKKKLIRIFKKPTGRFGIGLKAWNQKNEQNRAEPNKTEPNRNQTHWKLQKKTLKNNIVYGFFLYKITEPNWKWADWVFVFVLK